MDFAHKRIKDLLKHIDFNYQLLNEYETLLDIEYSPKRKFSITLEIDRIKSRIGEYQTEFRDLKYTSTESGKDQYVDDLKQVGKKLSLLDGKISRIQSTQEYIYMDLVNTYNLKNEELRKVMQNAFSENETAIVKSINEWISTFSNQARQDLLEEVINEISKSTRSLIDNYDQNNDAINSELAELQKLVLELGQKDGNKISLSTKLKVTIPIIPYLIKLEKEVGVNSGLSTRNIYQKIKNILF